MKTSSDGTAWALIVTCVLLTGCQSMFADAAQHRCVEQSLRRAPREMVLAVHDDLVSSCRVGDAPACSALGVIEEDGLLGPARPALARRLFARSCEGGDVRGCTNLGRVTFYGVGGARDGRVGLELLGRSCNSGDPAACGALGGALLDAPPSLDLRGPALLRGACEAGEGTACLRLVDAFKDGQAQPSSPTDSTALILRACALGHDRACDRGAQRLVVEGASKAVSR